MIERSTLPCRLGAAEVKTNFQFCRRTCFRNSPSNISTSRRACQTRAVHLGGRLQPRRITRHSGQVFDNPSDPVSTTAMSRSVCCRGTKAATVAETPVKRQWRLVTNKSGSCFASAIKLSSWLATALGGVKRES